MIPLNKGDCPDKLSVTAAAATATYLAAPPDKKPTPWNTPEIRAALREESRNKCMYCEAFPDDTAYGAVEHIKPKSVFPELVLEWANLGLACTRCNTNKSDYWATRPELRLIDPYEEDPTEHVLFSGPAAIPALGDTRAANTVRKLGLNREQLFLARSRRQQDLDVLITLWYSEDDPELKQILAEDVNRMISEDSEFSASLRAFAIWRTFPAAG